MPIPTFEKLSEYVKKDEQLSMMPEAQELLRGGKEKYHERKDILVTIFRNIGYVKRFTEFCSELTKSEADIIYVGIGSKNESGKQANPEFLQKESLKDKRMDVFNIDPQFDFVTEPLHEDNRTVFSICAEFPSRSTYFREGLNTMNYNKYTELYEALFNFNKQACDDFDKAVGQLLKKGKRVILAEYRSPMKKELVQIAKQHKEFIGNQLACISGYFDFYPVIVYSRDHMTQSGIIDEPVDKKFWRPSSDEYVKNCQSELGEHPLFSGDQLRVETGEGVAFKSVSDAKIEDCFGLLYDMQYVQSEVQSCSESEKRFDDPMPLSSCDEGVQKEFHKPSFFSVIKEQDCLSKERFDDPIPSDDEPDLFSGRPTAR